MKKKILALVLAVAMVLSLAACGGGSSSSNDSSISVTISEDTAWEFQGVYMTTEDQDTWGPNLASAGFDGEVTITLAAEGTYDLRLQDEDGDYWEFYGIAVVDGSAIDVQSWGLLTCDGTEVEGDLVFNTDATGEEVETPDPEEVAPVTADAFDQDILISTNLTGDEQSNTVWYVFMSTSTSNSWGEDLLRWGSTLCDPSDGQDTESVTITSNDGTTVFDLAYEQQNNWLGVAGIEMDGVAQIVICSGGVVETYNEAGDLLASYDAVEVESPMA